MKIKKDLKKFWERILYTLRIIYRFVGILFVVIGNSILGRKGKYQTLSHLIEDQFSSLDMQIKVHDTREFPLFVRFYIEIDSVSEKIIDWKYFTMELVYQIGAMVSDISIEKDFKRGKDSHSYTVDITKTAIGNLEKGLTLAQPLMFEPDSIITVAKKAVELIRTGKSITPKTLKNELKINEARAEDLYDQLKKTNVFAKKSSGMTVN